MKIKMIHELQSLKNDLLDSVESIETTDELKHQINEAIARIDLASIRLAQFEMNYEDNSEYQNLIETIEDATRNIGNNRNNYRIISKNIDRATDALNYVIAHVEPPEPWPKK